MSPSLFAKPLRHARNKGQARRDAGILAEELVKWYQTKEVKP